jgi:GxxExxY protein
LADLKQVKKLRIAAAVMSVQLEMDDAGKAILLRLRKMLCEVYETLGKGFPEGVYQKALGVELQAQHLKYDMEVTMAIPYKDHVVGQVRADIVIRGETPVIIETKATAAALKTEERWQLSRYLKILEIPLGILVNFPQIASSSEPQIEFLVLDGNQVLLYNLDTSIGSPLT